MRAALVIIVLAGCAGSMRPAVLPKLSALPGEPERRDAVLESAPVEPSREQERVIRSALPAALDQSPPPTYDASLVPWVKLK
jgi:hypothetical protein